MTTFPGFQKITRLDRAWIATEKIDGTNGVIYVPGGAYEATLPEGCDLGGIAAGSKNRWLAPGKQSDNFGFAGWVQANRDALIQGLGPGLHYGEWWRLGIQRGYGLSEKRFSLFNTTRYAEVPKSAPVSVVPVVAEFPSFLYAYDGVTDALEDLLDTLRGRSLAAPGYDNPEGIVLRHVPSGALFKYTFDGDAKREGR